MLIKNALFFAILLEYIFQTGYTVYMKLLTINEKIAFTHPSRDVDFNIWQQTKTMPHKHTFYELFIVTEGTLNHVINGKKEVFGKGTVRFIRPDDFHFQKALKNKNTKTINLSFTENFLNHYADFNEKTVRHLTEFQDSIIIKLNDAELSYITEYANKIIQAKNEERETSLINHLILFCLEKIPNIGKHRQKYPEWLNDLLNYIENLSDFSITIPKIAKTTNYSPSRLAVLFKQYTGETLVRYFAKTKIKRACNMLRNTNFSILDISVQLGYSSVSHFNRIFKEQLSCTPTEYRSQFGNNQREYR